MRLESHATIIIKTEKGERDLPVKDLHYDPDTMSFRYVYTGKVHHTLRENVRGFSERNPRDEY